MEFDGSQKLIGVGAQADVFEYQGYAYKVYRPTYPVEWIRFEKDQQHAVNTAGLCPVRYYDTDDEHTIKMDLIKGITLEKRVMAGDPNGFNMLRDAFRFVHSADPSGIKMPRLTDTITIELGDEGKKLVPIIERLSEKMGSRICHLDMHFLNLMVREQGDDYTIIDWMNSRIAPVVFDYARTYVIFDEFSKEGLRVYEAVVMPDVKELGVSDSDFADALTVCSAIRKHEKS